MRDYGREEGRWRRRSAFEYPEARVKLHELTMDATKKKEEEEEEGEEVNLHCCI